MQGEGGPLFERRGERLEAECAVGFRGHGVEVLLRRGAVVWCEGG